jgi:mannose-6-phosphate isomerase-like protein (cupin superfamily)
MAKNTSRRNFLRTAPVAAAASLALADTLLAATPAAAQAPAPPAAASGAAPGADVARAAVPFQYFANKTILTDADGLQASPGNVNLVDQKPGLPCAIVLTVEVHKSAAEFEWHEGRDHIIQIVDGSTTYEIGGVPKNGRMTKPGEYLAPTSEGSRSLVLAKGDMLVIPRGTPHKRSTEDNCTFILISPYGTMKA